MISELNNYPDYIEKVFEFKAPPGKIPERLDVFLTNNIRNATRTKVQKAIDEGNVTINGKIGKANKKIQPNDLVICTIMKPPPIELIPENIPLDVIFEDEHLLVVNKPPGMVTHPGFGNRYGTLVNAVLYHTGFRDVISFETSDDEDNSLDEGLIFSSDAVRPGVVHRLDKDTSGLLVVSKNPVVHAQLAEQFADRTIERYYNAIVWGNFSEESGTYYGNIGRSPRDRKLFAVVKRDGKPAITDYTILETFTNLSLAQVKLRTGRTHQIRVHFSHNRHSVFGDPDYNGTSINYGGNTPAFKVMIEKLFKTINRQMLHAKTLGFVHPVTKEFLKFESPLPEDMKTVIQTLQNYTSIHNL